MPRVLVVATGRKTRGGITSVIKAHETGEQWKKYHCVWIQTHRDGAAWRKILYYLSAWIEFLCLLPFCDIVHFHCAGKTSAKRKIAFAKLARECRKLVICHFHPPGPDDIEDEQSHDIVKTLFDQAHKVIVLSPYWERLINEAYPDRNYPMEVLWNPCPEAKRDFSTRKKQILFAGTLCKRKGYDVLLKAFGKIATKYPEWKVVFAGNPYLLEGINELEDGKHIAAELGIANQVEWLGWVTGDMKERTFQESAVYCLASEGEGFPMGVLDAWAYGIPCVMTPVGGILDIVKNAVNGLIFPVGDIDALAQELDQMLSDTTLRKNIVKESDKWVYGDFCVKSVTEHLGNIYKNLLSNH